jgi:hypothetical protein
MLSIQDYLPQVNLNNDLEELINYQLLQNPLLQQPKEDKFAALGIFLPDDSLLKPADVTNPKPEREFKYEFALSVAADIAARINQNASGSFSKRFPLGGITQSSTTSGKIILKLPFKNKPDISQIIQDDIVPGDVSCLLAGQILLVEGVFKPYQIPNSSSGVLFELVSIIVLGSSDTQMVASPTKRKIRDFLEERKRLRSN